MAAKSNYFANRLLLLIFNAVAMDNIARDAILGSLNLTVALHTADPGVAGDQSTNEISYTGYARVSVARTSAGWTVTNEQVALAADIDFPAYAGGTGGIVTYFSVGTGYSNAMLYRGVVSPSLNISSSGNIPRLYGGSTLITEG